MRFAIIICQFVCISVGAAANERIRDVGYFIQTTRSVYFVRSLKILASGLPIEDKRALESGSFCILQEKTEPPRCPPQEISFVLSRKGTQLVARELALEKETEWHRLNRVDKFIQFKK